TKLGLTILLIEHVLRAVMALSSRIVVLHHGEVIASGTPAEVTRDPAVLECYLGEEAVSCSNPNRRRMRLPLEGQGYRIWPSICSRKARSQPARLSLVASDPLLVSRLAKSRARRRRTAMLAGPLSRRLRAAS